MLKNIIVFALVISCIACNDTSVDVDEYTDQTLLEVSLDTRSGPSGCYELILPISFLMPNGEEIEIQEFSETKAAFRAWKEENPDVTGRPELQFPIDLIDEEGEIISVDTSEDLREIRRACRAEFIQHLGRRCYKIVYPIEILFPDGEIIKVNNKREFKFNIRKWRVDHPGSEERPSLNFPIEIEKIEDGEIIVVNSKEEIRQLKEDCR